MQTDDKFPTNLTKNLPKIAKNSGKQFQIFSYGYFHRNRLNLGRSMSMGQVQCHVRRPKQKKCNETRFVMKGILFVMKPIWMGGGGYGGGGGGTDKHKNLDEKSDSENFQICSL